MSGFHLTRRSPKDGRERRSRSFNIDTSRSLYGSLTFLYPFSDVIGLFPTAPRKSYRPDPLPDFKTRIYPVQSIDHILNSSTGALGTLVFSVHLRRRIGDGLNTFRNRELEASWQNVRWQRSA
jgi:hypothetical protein